MSIRFMISTKKRIRPVRARLKIHSRHLHAPLCGIFAPNSVNVARYASLIGAKSPTKCDAQLTESNFQTHSRARLKIHSRACTLTSSEL